jgi:hypothetical protein
MKVIIERLDNGELGMTLPKAFMDSGLYLPGDHIDYAIKGQCCALVNRSCPVLPLSRFRRNLNGILRNLNNSSHPLRRVLIVRKKHAFWCVPHDRSLWPAFLLAEVSEPDTSEDKIKG